MRALPTPRLAALLATVSALFVGALAWPDLVAAAVATDVTLALAAALDFALAPSAAELELRVTHPARVPLARRVQLRVEVRHHGRRPCTLTALRDVLHPALGSATLRGRWPLAPDGRCELAYDVYARRRGRLDLGPITLRIAGPLGLAFRQVTFPTERRLAVVPGIESIRRYELLALVGRLRELGLRSTRWRGAGTSFASLREYAPGEDLRRIDWKASARRGKWISREYEAERSQNVWILLDAGRRMTAELSGRARFEYAIPAALLLAHVAGLNGDRVGLLVFSDRVHRFLPPMRGPAAERAILEALTDVNPALVEPDYPGAFRHWSTRARRRSLVVVFTDVIDELASQALVHQILALPRHHLVLTVALKNPELDAWARARPERLQDAFRKGAAEEMLQARAQALARMERAGVTVADVLPTDATPETVNRYLEFKRRLWI